MSANKTNEPPSVSVLPERVQTIIAAIEEDSIILDQDDIQMFLMDISLLSFREIGRMLKSKSVNTNVGSAAKMKKSKELVELLNGVAEKITGAIDDYDDAIRLHENATKTLNSVSNKARELNNICRKALGRPNI